MAEIRVEIAGQIRLGQLLKYLDIVDSGAQIRPFLAQEQLKVNGQIETRRGRQIHSGDLLSLADGRMFRIVIDAQ